MLKRKKMILKNNQKILFNTLDGRSHKSASNQTLNLGVKVCWSKMDKVLNQEMTMKCHIILIWTSEEVKISFLAVIEDVHLTRGIETDTLQNCSRVKTWVEIVKDPIVIFMISLWIRIQEQYQDTIFIRIILKLNFKKDR